MAAATITLHVVTHQPERIDELCTRCWKPALWLTRMSFLSDDGVRTFSYRLCTDCQIATPLNK